MTPLPDGKDSERDLANDQDISIPGFEELAGRVRSRLKLGGPEVDSELLADYAASEIYEELHDELPDAIRNSVREKVRTWLNWHEEYWKLRAYQDMAEEHEEFRDQEM